MDNFFDQIDYIMLLDLKNSINGHNSTHLQRSEEQQQEQRAEQRRAEAKILFLVILREGHGWALVFRPGALDLRLSVKNNYDSYLSVTLFLFIKQDKISGIISNL